MRKGGVVVVRGLVWEMATADVSTGLRSGRDDKRWGGGGPGLWFGKWQPQISPLRCAPVEMTKGRVVVVRVFGLENGSRGSLRCAPVEMTKGRAVVVRDNT